MKEYFINVRQVLEAKSVVQRKEISLSRKTGNFLTSVRTDL